MWQIRRVAKLESHHPESILKIATWRGRVIKVTWHRRVIRNTHVFSHRGLQTNWSLACDKNRSELKCLQSKLLALNRWQLLLTTPAWSRLQWLPVAWTRLPSYLPALITSYLTCKLHVIDCDNQRSDQPTVIYNTQVSSKCLVNVI